MKKRFLSMLMVATLLLSMLVVNASAAGGVSVDTLLGAATVITPGTDYTQTVTLGTGTLVTPDSGDDYYATAYAVDLTANQTIYIEFGAMWGSVDTRVDVYTAIDATADSHNSASGEAFTYTAATAGTYYFVCTGADATVNSGSADFGMWFNFSSPQQVLENATQISALPYTDAAVLLDSSSLLAGTLIGSAADYPYNLCCGKAYKMSMTAGEKVSLTFGSTGSFVSTYIDVFIKSGNTYSLDSSGGNNSSSGRELNFAASVAGEYYFLCRNYSQNDTGTAALSVTVGDFFNVADAAAAAVSVSLPYTAQLTLDDTSALIIDNSYNNTVNGYGTTYKLAMTAGQSVVLDFQGVDPSLDTEIFVFSGSLSNLSMQAHYDNDLPNGDGEAALFTAYSDGNYYFVCVSDGSGQTGAATLSISAATTVPIKQALTEAEVVTLPASKTVSLSPHNTLIDDGSELQSGSIYGVAMTAGQTISVTFGVATLPDYCDTGIDIYALGENGKPVCVDRLDNDNYRDNGERVDFTATTADTYYFLVRALSTSTVSTCSFTATAYTEPGDTIDLAAVGISCSGALWSWDASTMTLTLEDGFNIRTENNCILLPDGAQVLVKGAATLSPMGDGSGIYAYGDVTVTLASGANLSVDADNGYAIGADDNVTVRAAAGAAVTPTLTTETYDDSFSCDSLTLSGLSLTLESYDDPICASVDVLIENCHGTLDAGDNAIVDFDTLTIKNSVLKLWSSDDTIYSYESTANDVTIADSDLVMESRWGTCMDISGALRVTGGSLTASSYYAPLYASTAISVASDTQLKLTASSQSGDSVLYADGKITLGGRYHFYNAAGELLYTGALTADMLESNTIFVTVNGESVAVTAIDTAYVVTEGADSTWQQGSSTGLTFKSNGKLADLTGVYVDGMAVDAANYDAVSGSTILTLKSAYLQTLSVGTHTLAMTYTGGYTNTVSFQVLAGSTPPAGGNGTSPSTGDDSALLLYAALGIVTLGAGALLLKEKEWFF